MDLPSLICDACPTSQLFNDSIRTVKYTHSNSAVEAPSGKDQKYENFPVGSWVLPAKLRPHIATFYKFARTIDDIADTNSLSAEENRRLSMFEATLTGKIFGHPTRGRRHAIEPP